jgi:DNA-binding NtrC family response regulator
LPLPSVLLIDQDSASLSPLREALHRLASVEHAGSLQQGLERLRRGRWAATLLSLDTPLVDQALVGRLVEPGSGAGVVLLLARSPTMQVTLDAARAGVHAVLSTPLDPEKALDSLREVLSPVGKVVALEESGAELAPYTAVGSSPAMLEVFRTMGRVSRSPATVLILGESGTGKELVARAIHRNSERAAGPFVAINCAAIPENLLESELFGHEKGAFTGAVTRKIGRFERASGGTLLLDEIGDMSLALQSKILRALQEREIERVGGDGSIAVDVRVIAATHRDLRAEIAKRKFREDLYFRLAVVTIELPRLVDRADDLDLLTRHFVALHARTYGRDVRGVEQALFQRLREHDWPGNIRELRNVLERAVLLSGGHVLLASHLPPLENHPGHPVRDPQLGAAAGAGLPEYSRGLTLAEVERLHIEAVIRSVGGHLGRASEVLGLHRNTLTRKVRELGLKPSRLPE